MRRFREQQRGLAEIVGTLMLVLIVVAAVTAFSLFVASYQQQVQSEEAHAHDQALESLRVTAIRPIYNSTAQAYRSLNLTVVSNDINPTVIVALTVNDNSVTSYNVTTSSVPLPGITIPNGGLLITNGDFSMPAESSVTILVTFGGHYSSFNYTVTLSDTQYVKVNLFTADSNTFTQVFLPPTAAIAVTEQTVGLSSLLTILDGSKSYQQGGNSTILSWNWTVQNETWQKTCQVATPPATCDPSKSNEGNLTVSPCSWVPIAICYGIAAPVNWVGGLYPGNIYTIDLIVTNTDGMVGESNITYAPQ